MYYRYEKAIYRNLTPDYAAIPQEMKKAAECLEKNFLGEVSKEEIINNITRIRNCVVIVLHSGHYTLYAKMSVSKRK